MTSVGESDAGLERRLQARFRDANIHRDDAALKSTLSAVKKLIAGKGHAAEMRFDLRGTEFQKRVWAELLRIPVGETRSYADIAARIGSPKAFRAVANACGANPVAIAVPCHRVIASAGKLGGYSGGLDRKQKLLANEGVQFPD